MGEAKDKDKRAAIEQGYHASDRELAALTLFLLGSVNPTNRLAQRRYNRIFAELRLEQFEGLASVKLDNYSDVGHRVSTSMDSVEYLLEVTDGQMTGPFSRALMAFIERLLEVKGGSYTAPLEIAGASRDAAIPPAADDPKGAAPTA